MVHAGGPWGTGGSSTVVQVLLAACASPATYTHTVEATSRVLAGTPISTARGMLGLTFIHIFRAVPACRRVGQRHKLELGVLWEGRSGSD